MQFDYKSAKAAISSGILSIQGTVDVNVTGGSLTAQAAISGQKVYLANDGVNNVVAISPTANTVKAQNSGQVAYLANDNVNNVVFAKIDPSNNTVKAQNSGQVGYLVNDNVNNVVFAKIDPANNTVKAQNSGQVSYLANDGVNNVAKISGQMIYTHGTTPKTAPMVTCTGSSGGTQLPNLACIRLLVRSMSGNNVMFVSGIGANAPFSGNGVELYGGEMLPPLEIDNANEISIFAATSGQKVSIMAIA